MMDRQYDFFQYKLLGTVPEEFRQVDWTYLSLCDKPFSECKEAFDRLKKNLGNAFAGNPFFYLHFLRAIEDRLIRLALDRKQPLSECLEQLRRRLELEYSREDIYGKAAMVVLFADYAIECGEGGLARSLLEQERDQLKATAEICRDWMETVVQRIERIPGGGRGDKRAS